MVSLMDAESGELQVSLVYGVVGGIQASQGQDFRYWLVGDWVRGILTIA